VMKFRIIPIGLLSLVAAVTAWSEGSGSNWPQWRGPNHNGTNPAAKNLAVEWDTAKNVVWKTALPSWSAATPIIWGDTIFVTSPEEGFNSLKSYEPRRGGGGRRGPGASGRPGGRQAGPPASDKDKIALLAINRADGKIKWRATIGQGNRIYRKQNLSSPSPITDGRRVWTMTGSGTLACYDFKGEKYWERNIPEEYGAFGLNHGYASTPLLHQGKLYIQVLHGMKTDDPSYVFAVDPKTGKTLWKVERPTDADSESPDDYSTPIIVRVKGTEQLIVSGGDYVTGHNLSSGKELWRMGGFNPEHQRAYRTIASSINIGETVYTPSTRGNPFIAFKAGGEGWITDTARVWENALGADVPTPTTDGKNIYVINDRGILIVLDAKTGETVIERKRLEPGTYSSSPLLADGKIYATNEEGSTSVIQVGGDYEILAVNKLASHTLASPVAVDDQLYLRTAEHLYCIAKK
jgi:outer membrane protein assembly factor BamB